MLSSGPDDAKIIICGEAAGTEEVSRGMPFVGYSGQEFNRMLGEAGLNRTNCFLMNVVDHPIGDPFYDAKTAKIKGVSKVDGVYPKHEMLVGRERLRALIRQRKPNLVILLGNAALWALLGENGIMKWRGSILEFEGTKVIPTYNPAAILRNLPFRWIAVQDLRRCRQEAEFPEVRKPAWNFIVRPSFETAMDWMADLKDCILTGDTETSIRQIACFGIAKDKLNAICIPFHTVGGDRSYWSEEEEIRIVSRIREIARDKSIEWVFQNGLYDQQYAAINWGVLFNIKHDTMVMQHTAFPTFKKSLDFLSSMYCSYYRYWKDDGKNWNPTVHEEEQHWIYNCSDCVYTYECFESLEKTIKTYELWEQYQLLMDLYGPVLSMMLRGTKIDIRRRSMLDVALLKANEIRMSLFEQILGHPLNPKSPDQMKKLFYDDLQVKKIISRKTFSPTMDDDALEKIKDRHPLFKPIINMVQECRSIGIFRSNFVQAAIDEENRIRCSFNLTGANTYRFSSSKDAFGNGANLQTIPKGSEDEDLTPEELSKRSDSLMHLRKSEF